MKMLAEWVQQSDKRANTRLGNEEMRTLELRSVRDSFCLRLYWGGWTTSEVVVVVGRR